MSKYKASVGSTKTKRPNKPIRLKLQIRFSRTNVVPIKVVEKYYNTLKLKVIRSTGKMYAVVAVPHNTNQSSKQYSSRTWRVFLDSGSNEDLMFNQYGNKETRIPSKERFRPQKWKTSNVPLLH